MSKTFTAEQMSIALDLIIELKEQIANLETLVEIYKHRIEELECQEGKRDQKTFKDEETA